MKLLESLVPGTELKLKREPENKHDRWAIAIYTNEGLQLGYVARYKNEAIARLMDSGYVFSAYVEYISMGKQQYMAKLVMDKLSRTKQYWIFEDDTAIYMDEFEISANAEDVLKQNGIVTVKDILDFLYSQKSFIELKGINEDAENENFENLNSLGFTPPEQKE